MHYEKMNILIFFCRTNERFSHLAEWCSIAAKLQLRFTHKAAHAEILKLLKQCFSASLACGLHVGCFHSTYLKIHKVALILLPNNFH